MKTPLWNIQGHGRFGPVTLTLRAEDHNVAVRIAAQRRVRVEAASLVDEDPEASRLLAVKTLFSLRQS